MIPSYEQIEDPLLRLLANSGPVTVREATSHIADHFHLSQEERTQTMSSGRRTYVADRTAWAATYLSKAGLVARPKRGVLAITDRGRETIARLNGTPVTNDVLRAFNEFQEFVNRTPANGEGPKQSSTGPTPESDSTPDARIAEAIEELEAALAEQLLERVRTMDDGQFEHLVVDLLVKMGYGGTLEDAGKVIGGSGDGGIDGIIKEDRLGLDNIYVQAKRWKEGNNVSRPDVQQFMGALVGKGARKGIFITASAFSKECREFVRDKEVSIVLLDGPELVDLMLEHGVGVSVRDTVVLKDIDEDYFEGA